MAEDGENLRSRTTPVAFIAKGKIWVNNHAHILDGGPEADVRFVAYAVENADISGYLTGSTQPKLTQQALLAIRLPWPPLVDQCAIAEVLEALDDKIESNLLLATRAYDLALVIGLKACRKAAGTTVGLSEVTQLTRGVSYRSEDLVPGRGWLVGLKCAARDGSFRRDGLKPYDGPFKEAQEVRAGDILVAQTDITQRAEVIGRPIRLPRLSVEGTLVASLDFIVVRPGRDLTSEMLLAILSTQRFRDYAISRCNGTTVLHMSASALPNYPVQFPLPSEVATTSSVMARLLALSDEAQLEAEALAALRDTLLPGLLSGDLRVRDAETFVRAPV